MNNVRLLKMSRKKSKNYRVIVQNDSVNTFHHVQKCLQEICGHNLYQSIQCTNIIHNNGQCQVYSNKHDQSVYIFHELKSNGLKVKLIK